MNVSLNLTELQRFICLVKSNSEICILWEYIFANKEDEFIAQLTEQEIKEIAEDLEEKIIFDKVFGEFELEEEDEDCYEMQVYTKILDGFRCKYYTSPHQGLERYADITKL